MVARSMRQGACGREQAGPAELSLWAVWYVKGDDSVAVALRRGWNLACESGAAAVRAPSCKGAGLLCRITF